MKLVAYWGHEIFLRGRAWEVWTAEGALIAEGVGGLKEARSWVQQQLLRLAVAIILERH